MVKLPTLFCTSFSAILKPLVMLSVLPLSAPVRGRLETILIVPLVAPCEVLAAGELPAVGEALDADGVDPVPEGVCGVVVPQAASTSANASAPVSPKAPRPPRRWECAR